MINRYYKPEAYKPEFYAPPIETLSKVMDFAQKQYDTNYALSEEIKNNQVYALDKDRKRADEILSGYEARIDDVVKKYSGDYSRATKDLNVLLSDLKKQYRPGGEIDAIQSNYKKFNDWEASERARLKEGKVTSTMLTLARQSFLDQYEGIGDKDPATGAYRQIMTMDLPEYVDGSKLAMEALDKLKPRKISRLVPKIDAQGNRYNFTEEVEGIDPQEANAAVSNALYSDDKWTQYTGFMSGFNDRVSPDQYFEDSVKQLQDAFVPLHSGVFNDTRKEEYKGLDDLTKLRMQQAHDRSMESMKQYNRLQLQANKKKLEQDDDEEGMSRLESLGVNQGAGIKFNRIGPGNSTTEEQSIFDNAIVSGVLGSFGPTIKKGLKPLGIDPKMTVSKSQTSYPSVTSAIATGTAGRENINVVALEQARKANPGKPDAVVWEHYNDLIATQSDFGNSIYYKPTTQPKQMRQAADVLIPKVLGGNFDVKQYVDGKLVDLTGDEVSEKFKKMVNDKGKVLPSAVWQGQTRSYAGDAPLGDLITFNGQKFLVSAKDEKLQDYNTRQRKAIFGHISTGATFSDPFEMYDEQGKAITSKGVLSYELNPTTGRTEPNVKYYAVDPNTGEINYNDPWQYPDKRYYRPADVEENIIGRQARGLLVKRLGKDTNPTFGYDETDE